MYSARYKNTLSLFVIIILLSSISIITIRHSVFAEYGTKKLTDKEKVFDLEHHSKFANKFKHNLKNTLHKTLSEEIKELEHIFSTKRTFHPMSYISSL